MRKELWTYLKQRPNAELLVLSLVAIVGLCVLLFKPYRIYEWVNQNETGLFWAEIIVLVTIGGVLLHHVSNLKERLAMMASEQDDKGLTQMFNFYDERGELKLSVKPENLYYIESADNYVQIHYENLGKMQTMMMRNSMKNIEWRFQDSKLIRCHRSYLVNLRKVQMLKRVEGEMLLDFNNEKIAPLPVSKAYADGVLTYFAQQ
ncbi:MAG: LytTR family transcriptional regulator [Paludibacteraceae bacterium]|nr:LytTR family transcriptional regulator [Paludibacteraceae bacterium]